jgi:hypothetical protein
MEIFLDLPKELWIYHIFRSLNRHDLLSLKCTCRYIYSLYNSECNKRYIAHGIRIEYNENKSSGFVSDNEYVSRAVINRDTQALDLFCVIDQSIVVGIITAIKRDDLSMLKFIHTRKYSKNMNDMDVNIYDISIIENADTCLKYIIDNTTVPESKLLYIVKRAVWFENYNALEYVDSKYSIKTLPMDFLESLLAVTMQMGTSSIRMFLLSKMRDKQQ